MNSWPVWVAALWWGSLTTLGFAVVPLLFAYLPSPALAGMAASRLFQFQTWVSAVLGLLLLMATRAQRFPAMARRVHGALPFIVAGMLLALLVEFAVAPRILARENLRLWHGVGSAMYLLQWICAAVTFARLIQPDAGGGVGARLD